MATQGIKNLQGNKGKSYQILVQVSLKWELISELQTFEDNTIKLLYNNHSFWNLYLGFLECRNSFSFSQYILMLGYFTINFCAS
jgi:hypothetical protein